MELVIQLFTYNYLSEDGETVIFRKKRRQAEFDFCFLQNLALSFVNKVHIFLAKPSDEEYFINIILGDNAETLRNKCVFIPFNRQPHYKDFVEYIQNKFDDNKIVCIMNSDILLDHTMDFSLIQDNLVVNQMFGITRHEYTTEYHEVCNQDTCYILHKYSGSHDMFIIRTPVSKDIELEAIDFKQNIFGAEAIFQRTFKNAGYIFKNPCYQIRGYHVHADKVYFEQYNCIGNLYDFGEYPSAI
jgi:hypothetical protein